MFIETPNPHTPKPQRGDMWNCGKPTERPHQDAKPILARPTNLLQ